MNPPDILLTVRRFVGAVRYLSLDFRTHLQYRGDAYPRLYRRLLEQGVLLITNATTAADYYNLGLYDPDKTWRDKRQYLGHYMLSRTYGYINREEAHALFKDKGLFQLLCLAHQLPVIEILAEFEDGAQRRFPWKNLGSAEELRAFLEKPEIEQIFIKPSSEQQGAGVLALGRRVAPRIWERVPARGDVTLDDVFAHIAAHRRGMRWIVQRRAQSHPLLAEIVPQVLSTMRVVTLNEGTPYILFAFMRFGSGATPADNFSCGGTVSAVDLLSGRLGPGLVEERGTTRFLAEHPTTGVKIEGLTVPYWGEIQSLAIDAAKRFSDCRCIGWDIGITADGPVIVEANSKSGFLSIQGLTGKGILAGPLGDLLRPFSGLARAGATVPGPEKGRKAALEPSRAAQDS